MLLGVGHGGGREDEGRLGAVARGDPPQPSQHRRHVRPEDALVDVALVDDDVAQRPQERAPALVPGQQRVVEQVGVGEHEVGVVADPAALVGRGVAVVGRGPHRRQREPVDAAQLVGGERLGGGEVERRGAATVRCARPGDEVAEHRQVVAEALARGRARADDDVPSGVGGLRHLDLVRPRRLDAGGEQGAEERRVDPLRPLAVDGAAGRAPRGRARAVRDGRRRACAGGPPARVPWALAPRSCGATVCRRGTVTDERGMLLRSQSRGGNVTDGERSARRQDRTREPATRSCARVGTGRGTGGSLDHPSRPRRPDRGAPRR